MTVQSPRRTVLVAALEEARALLCQALAGDRRDWEVLQARSVEQVRFTLQHEACDAVLLDQGCFPCADTDELLDLAARHAIPVVVLTVPGRETGCAEGSSPVLPLELALRHPAILGEVLEQTVGWRNLHQGQRRAAEALCRCQQQVSHLVALLWEAMPGGGSVPWCTQRCVMEVFWKQSKQEMGLGDYQMLRYRGVVRYLHLVLIACLLLTHLGLCEPDVKAELKGKGELRLPSLAQLQTRLRGLLWEDVFKRWSEGTRYRAAARKLREEILV
jgi:hypothetical protein